MFQWLKRFKLHDWSNWKQHPIRVERESRYCKACGVKQTLDFIPMMAPGDRDSYIYSRVPWFCKGKS